MSLAPICRERYEASHVDAPPLGVWAFDAGNPHRDG